MIKCNPSKKKEIAKFFNEQLNFKNNCSQINHSWLGSGPHPLDYSLLFDHDQDPDTSNIASKLTFVGTVGLVETDRYKTLVHLTSVEVYLGDESIWLRQIQGINDLVDKFPKLNDKLFQIKDGYISSNHLTFKINNKGQLSSKQTPVAVCDNADNELEGEYSALIDAGDLVIVFFVPYAYETGPYHGISLSPKTIKIVKKNFVPASSLIAARIQPILSDLQSPAKKQKVILSIETPNTTNLGF